MRETSPIVFVVYGCITNFPQTSQPKYNIHYVTYCLRDDIADWFWISHEVVIRHQLGLQ